MIKQYADFNSTMRAYPDALTRDTCKDIIEVFEKNKEAWRPGETLSGIVPDIKMTHDLCCHESPDLLYAEEIFTKVSNEHVEQFLYSWPHQDKWDPTCMFGSGTHYPYWQIQKYDKNRGHYNAWHTEEPYYKGTAHRLFVCCFYLNDVEEGGHTEFLYSDLKIQPKAGTFVIFPAGWPWIHRGGMPISNHKYFSTTWLCADWGPIEDTEGRDV